MTRNEYTVDELADVLLRAGFVECNIAACNCGSWHHRYGLPERFSEIKDALMDAGVLNNETGNLPIRAIAKLVEQREALRSRLAELERNEGTLLGMIRHQQDVLRECLPYLNESMAGKRPGRSADDIRAAVKALTTDSASVTCSVCNGTGLHPDQYSCIFCTGTGKADQPTACANCGGSGIIRWQAYDGTEEGHEEQDPCPVCAANQPGEAAK